MNQVRVSLFRYTKRYCGGWINVVYSHFSEYEYLNILRSAEEKGEFSTEIVVLVEVLILTVPLGRSLQTLMMTASIDMLTVALTLFGLVKSCQTLTFEGSRTTYGKFTPWIPCHNGSVTLDFKTTQANTLIFYTHYEETKDYFELDLVDGIMQLHFKIQGKRDRLSAGSNLNDDKWHTVKIMRDGRLTILTVDQITYTREYKAYDPEKELVYTSKENFVYIGGLPMSFNDRLSELPLTQVLFHQRLRGSVRNLFYSNCGQALVAGEMLDSDGIIFEEDECMHTNPCKHGGICVMRDSGVQCDCSWTDYTGEFCEEGEGFIGVCVSSRWFGICMYISPNIQYVKQTGMTFSKIL